MKRLFQLFALTVAVAATLSAEVPTGTHLKQGNVNLYVTQLTAEPIFNVPGAVPGGDWHEWFIVSVWNTADLPVEAFRVTVTCTLHGRTTVNTQVLPRYMSAGAEGIPISGFFHLGADAKITSVLVEELVPVASEQF